MMTAPAAPSGLVRTNRATTPPTDGFGASVADAVAWLVLLDGVAGTIGVVAFVVLLLAQAATFREPVLAPSLAGEPLELDAETERIGERSEDVLGDVIADVGHREGGARGGHRYACPKLDSTHSGSRTAG